MKKKIPVGHEDIKRLIDGNFYYIDKTMLIKELLDSEGQISLFTRPRRFGKTLNFSMIRRFFGDERDAQGRPIDNRYIFDGLQIASCGEAYMSKQGRYPVIKMSLKSAKQPNFQMAMRVLAEDIELEFSRHRYIASGDILESAVKEKFLRICDGKGDAADYATALRFLSRCLETYHGQKCVILIDEYDVPLEHAYFAGFYDEMIGFIRSLFESALKTNDSLEFGVITGCLRISRESIFTGLNNLEIYSIQRQDFSDCFGFTEDEMEKMTSYYGLEEKLNEIKDWYDGYRFGSHEIYNPWSITNYLKVALTDRDAFPKPYWSNTSSNSIIRELVETADRGTRGEIEQMIEGGTIEKPVYEDITYEDIHESRNNLWSFLYFTGYLKKVSERFDGQDIYLAMAIPNGEVRSIYKNSILQWFDNKIRESDMAPLMTAMEEGNCKAFAEFLSMQLLDTISIFDYAENYYHGFLAGLLKAADKYQVLSNRESGTGRPDLLVKTESVRGRAFILELKITKDFYQMEKCCDEALTQIRQKNYEAELRREGYGRIDKYGICFYRKECMIKREK